MQTDWNEPFTRFAALYEQAKLKQAEEAQAGLGLWHRTRHQTRRGKAARLRKA